VGLIVRGAKNAFRNSIRTVSIILILAVSVGMALVMLMALKTVEAKIASVKGSVGNYISISPAGIRGFEGGGELLSNADADSIGKIAHVKKVVKSINDRLTNGENTNLQPAIEAGSFGNRQRAQETNGTSENAPRNFSMPVMITGTNDLSVTSNLNVSKFDLSSGEKFDENSSDLVALIGTDLASKNNLSVNSTFQAYGKDVKVVGIFDGGNRFANASAAMPLKSLQNLSSQNDQVSQITVEADSIDTVASVTQEIKTKLGDKADVTSQQDSSQNAIKPLENIRTISSYSLIGALLAGAVIIFLTMVMIVRERRREIGVLKAIGASNAIVMAQFTVEALVFTLTSGVVGIVLGLILSNPVLNVLVNNSGSAQENPGGGGRQMMMRFAGGAQNTLRDLHAVVGWEIILYGLLAAILIAIIGSAVPAYLIAKVRPAEVLRSE